MANSKNLNPLDLPEIISRVGVFLSRDDILHCIQVCKAFHNTLVKSIWKRVVIVDSRYPTEEALQNYKEYIEELVFHNNFPKECVSLQGCNRLRFIESIAQDPSDLSQVVNLIKFHSSTITGLRFRCSHLWGIWEALMECVHLETLTIYDSNILLDGVDPFFQVCKKIKTLIMSDVGILRLPSGFVDDNTDEFIFPNVRKLELQNVRIRCPLQQHSSSYCLGILTRRCPRLRSLSFYDLRWGTQSTQQTDIDYYRTAFQYHLYTLTKLLDLSLISMQLKDEEMAALLKQMTELRQLVVPECDFGPLSLQELLADTQEIRDGERLVRKRRERRLCDTLEDLSFNRRAKSPDGIVQTILSNCPRLKTLWGPKITVTEIASGVEWVSTELTTMEVILEVDVDQKTVEGMRMQRIAFRQLGKLTRLQSLGLTGLYSSYEKTRTLDLKLSAGLDELVNLKNLRWLSFSRDDDQEIQPEDNGYLLC
ncbi:hypothetical protein BCR41DRAFT_351761 [Lobosporangium transversale]|uniref:F-box domain-containing protein n=1 Tax=Lobosporangium transversale TaxID=64571 RepID=A0A1Y2GSY0_9FUNG|nr:hypothetical protein BCR41DRAFT_351761 [Lobosporangium transversale]ORZ19212.1 hypothetical protein BCR41DRAFT_351761 [Lobosporangium transversale]|eukprot:XP_021882380.1 hypothetical protein BCR41DRAFT_351761 [Lobosporangium transversale]